jgi:uncharacterized membrane protein
VNVNENEPPGWRLPLANELVSAVTVWATASSLVQVTFAPTLTFRTSGWKEKPLMVAALVAVAAVVVAAVDAGAP